MFDFFLLEKTIKDTLLLHSHPQLSIISPLTKVHLTIGIFGFSALIGLLKKAAVRRKNFVSPSKEDVNKIGHLVNRVSKLFPIRTKCLEWSATYVLIALHNGFKCNLEIGVQNYPFVSHAWVEVGGNVVMDSDNLRSEMAIILREPF